MAEQQSKIITFAKYALIAIATLLVGFFVIGALVTAKTSVDSTLDTVKGD
mgnify:CR=1 FL=1